MSDRSGTSRPRAVLPAVLGVSGIVAAAVGLALAVTTPFRAAGLGLGVVAMALGIAGLRVASRRSILAAAGLLAGVVAVLASVALAVAAGLGPGRPIASATAHPSARPTRSVTPSPAPSFPTFAPLTTTARGSADIPLPSGASAGLVTAVFHGSGYFTIAGTDGQGTVIGDQLVDLYGTSYSGTTAFGVGGEATIRSLQVRGDGSWTITIAPVSSAPVLGASAAGQGDAVLRLENASAAAWGVTSSGAGLFSLQQVTTDGATLLAGTSGAYSGTVSAAGGTSLIVIRASGAWTLTRG